MNGDLLGNLALVVLFVLVGGVFAATEMALVTLRESQLTRSPPAGGGGRRSLPSRGTRTRSCPRSRSA